jgi:predicted nucleic acid-binding protein
VQLVIADASVLIALAKIGRLRLLKQVFASITMSPSVKREVIDEGVQRSAPEVAHVQQALNERWLRTARLNAAEKRSVQQLAGNTTLGPGEAESLAVARLRNVAFLVDEKEARTVARALGIEVIGTAGILYEAFRIGEISLNDLERAVEDLAKVIWLSPDIVADVLRRAREVRK